VALEPHGGASMKTTQSATIARLLCALALCSAWMQASPQTAATKKTMGYLDNGKIRIGVNLELGGAITFLAPSGSDENLINSYDYGRQIQMSNYCGPNPFTPNGKQPMKEWAALGWNPIQCGDVYGNHSKILDYKNDGKSIYVRCIPMQWPLNNEPGECTFECWIKLRGNTAEVRSRLNNHRSDLTQYGACGQELPAVYTNGPFYRLMTYTGDRPFTDGELTQIPAAFPWSVFQSTENWAALVNDAGKGVGIWEPGVTTFVGGFSGETGKGGPKDPPTGYIAPLGVDILDHNIAYEYRYVLIVGSLEEIRSKVYAKHRDEAPPSYRFKTDRRGWYYAKATDTGWPIRGELKVLLDADNPQMIGPTGFWKAEGAPKLKIEAAYSTKQTQARVFWKRSDAPEFDLTRSVSFAIIPDGKYHTYTVDLSASPEYRGAITGLRLDPVEHGGKGDYVRIRSISLCR
jgi:hypothetical protein